MLDQKEYIKMPGKEGPLCLHHVRYTTSETATREKVSGSGNVVGGLLSPRPSCFLLLNARRIVKTVILVIEIKNKATSGNLPGAAMK